MLFPCSTHHTIKILLKEILNHIQYLPKRWKKKERKFTINDEILSSPSTLIFETKVLKIP
jgi:hypothetical protein